MRAASARGFTTLSRALAASDGASRLEDGRLPQRRARRGVDHQPADVPRTDAEQLNQITEELADVVGAGVKS